jgi:hypothetical protein
MVRVTLHFSCSPNNHRINSSLEVGDAIDKLTKIDKRLDTLDINDKQVFPFADPVKGRVLKLTFGSSTDFYGRVTIYSYEVYGQES